MNNEVSECQGSSCYRRPAPLCRSTSPSEALTPRGRFRSLPFTHQLDENGGTPGCRGTPLRSSRDMGRQVSPNTRRGFPGGLQASVPVQESKAASGSVYVCNEFATVLGTAESDFRPPAARMDRRSRGAAAGPGAAKTQGRAKGNRQCKNSSAGLQVTQKQSKKMKGWQRISKKRTRQ